MGLASRKYRQMISALDEAGITVNIYHAGGNHYELHKDFEIIKAAKSRKTCNRHLIALIEKHCPNSPPQKKQLIIMNFFQQLNDLTPNLDVNIKIVRVSDKLTVSVLPDKAKDLRPLTLTGTAQEMDEGFMAAVSEPIVIASNLDNTDFLQQLQEKAAKASKADTNKKAAPASTAKGLAKTESKESPAQQPDSTPSANTAQHATAAAPAAEASTATTDLPFPAGTRVIYSSPGKLRGYIGTVADRPMNASGEILVDFDSARNTAVDPKYLEVYTASASTTKAAETNQEKPAIPDFKVGDAVTITDGPHKSRNAKVSNTDLLGESGRLVVELDNDGGPIQIDARHITPVPPVPAATIPPKPMPPKPQPPKPAPPVLQEQSA